MAILATIKKTEPGFSGELVAENVYVKIAAISGGVDVLNYQAAGTLDGVQVFTGSYSFRPAINGENFIAQSYAHLKSMPEFAGAVDC